MSIVVNVTKKKTAISFYLDDKTNPVVIDFKAGTIVSFTSRSVKTVPARLKEAGKERFFASLLGELECCIRSGNDTQILKREGCLSYMDLIDLNQSIYNMPTEIPKGYINYLRQNNLKISCNTLYEFFAIQEALEIPAVYRDTFKRMTEQYDLEGISKEQRIILCKIVRNNEKIYDWEIRRKFVELVNLIRDLDFLDWTEFVDTNRTIEYNIKLIKLGKDKELNTKIEEKQKLFKFLENFETEEFKIIVPTSLQELRDEGRNQNNCVGYFYNADIARGTQAIYFIRKKSNPEKSFLTCRISVESGCTVEHRYFNNRDCTKGIEYDFIKMVDEFIKTNYKNS